MKIADHLVLYISSFPHTFDVNWTKQNAIHISKEATVLFIHDGGELISFSHGVRNILSLCWKHRYAQQKGSSLLPFLPIATLPFRRLRHVQRINNALRYVQLSLWVTTLTLLYKKRGTIIWFATPSETWSRYMFMFPRALAIYDCTDYFAGLFMGSEARSVNLREQAIIDRADIILANSPVLYRHLVRTYPKRKQYIHQVPTGYEIANYFSLVRGITHRITTDHRPTIGYIGTFNERMDFTLIRSVAEQLRTMNFVFIGDPDTLPGIRPQTHLVAPKLRSLQRLPNVTLYTGIPHKDLPGLVSQFTVGIIPYRTNDPFNHYSNPIKLYAYLARGVPVVSTNLPIMRDFTPHVRVARTPQEFIHHILQTTTEKPSAILRAKRRSLAYAHRIEKKLQAIRHILASYTPPIRSTTL